MYILIIINYFEYIILYNYIYYKSIYIMTCESNTNEKRATSELYIACVNIRICVSSRLS